MNLSGIRVHTSVYRYRCIDIDTLYVIKILSNIYFISSKLFGKRAYTMNVLVSYSFSSASIPITGCCNRTLYNGRRCYPSTDRLCTPRATGSIIADRVNDRQRCVFRTTDYGYRLRESRYCLPISIVDHLPPPSMVRRSNRRLMALPSTLYDAKQTWFNRLLLLIVCIML